VKNQLAAVNITRLDLVDNDGKMLKKRDGFRVARVLFPALLVAGEQLGQYLIGLIIVQ